jgi:hypothetical protein
MDITLVVQLDHHLHFYGDPSRLHKRPEEGLRGLHRESCGDSRTGYQRLSGGRVRNLKLSDHY